MGKKKKSKSKVLLSVALAASLCLPASINAQVDTGEHNKELWSAVKPLETVTSFLNTGAHPDDERSHLLAYLSRGLGVKTASMIANRGEGGQNEIGEELGNGLGIIRSREMIEASKVTGVEVFHLSEKTSDEIYDFGFSKSPDETLQKWGEDVTYERFIRLIRTYKPDVLMPSFLNVESQHGHHRAITKLSLRAFDDAADPSVFPEQIENGLEPWQVKKLYLPAKEENATVGVEIGDYDPVYGMTYPQLGEASRYLHKSQGMGNDIEAEPRTEYLQLVKSAVGDIPEEETTIFDGIPFDLHAYARDLEMDGNRVRNDLTRLQKELNEVVEAYPNETAVLEEAHDALAKLRETKKKVEQIDFNNFDDSDLLHRLNNKEDQLEEVSKVASQLEVNITPDETVLNQGATTTVTVDVKNKGTQTLSDVNYWLNAPSDWKVEAATPVPLHLSPGEESSRTFTVTVPEDADYYNPYAEDVLSTKVSYQVGEVVAYQNYSVNETVAVLPELSLKADPVTLVVNTAQESKESTVNVTVTNYTGGPVEADVTLDLPENWEAVDSKKVFFDENDPKTKTIVFSVKPPTNVSNEAFEINVEAEVDDKKINTSVQEISYDHIGTFYNLEQAVIRGVAFDLQFSEDKKIGYIESGFDLVADKLSEVGMDITKIEDVGKEDLSQYDVIVTGIRAYLSREDLQENNEKLLAYAENGGHVVVQYNKPWDNWDAENTAPYPLTIGQPSIEWRVTDEESSYEILEPGHPLFNTPNEITENDWEGWVQERGLYFPMEWSEEYDELLTMTDLDEDKFNSGILVTEYGEGTYIYTNLVWYRQIQNDVPGGYRIFTNLIEYEAE